MPLLFLVSYPQEHRLDLGGGFIFDGEAAPAPSEVQVLRGLGLSEHCWASVCVHYQRVRNTLKIKTHCLL